MVDLNLASRHLTVPLLSLCTWILSSSYVSVSRAWQRLPICLCVVFFHLDTATFPLSFRFWKSHVSFLQSCRLRWPSLSYVSRLPVWPVSKLHHARLSQKSEPGLYSSRILRTHMRLWISGVAVPECSDQEKHNMITYPCAKKYSAVNLQSFSLTLNQHQPPATN